MTESELKRFRKYLSPQPNGCVLWTGSKREGYGRLRVKRNEKWTGPDAHILAYEHFIGPIPEGKVLDHKCRTRACVNEYCTEPVTRGENVLRGETLSAANVKKTHCPKGHPYSGENLILASRSDGRKVRQCRECHREFDRRPSRRQRQNELRRIKGAMIRTSNGALTH